MKASRISAGQGILGIGSPRQEAFAHAHRHTIQAVQLCVGAAFDFQAGYHQAVEVHASCEPSVQGDPVVRHRGKLAADGIAIRPYYLEGFWKDVGTAEDLKIATELIEGEELSDGCCSG